MRFTSFCISAPKLPAAIVSTAISATMAAAERGNRKAALSRNAKPAAFVPVAMSAVTGVGLPLYTSGTHRWKGNTLTLKNKLAAISATMAAGNFGALLQTSVKRMLAYSGVAHAGTLLLAVAGSLAGDPEPSGAVRAALYYMAAYVFTAGGAFGLVAWLERDGVPVTVDSLRGLAQKRPAVAAAMMIFMLSLGGIPFTGGFLGKYLVFSVAVRANLIPAAVIGVLLSVVALAYYLRVVVAMYMQSASARSESAGSSGVSAALATAACAILVIVLGTMPGWFLDRMG